MEKYFLKFSVLHNEEFMYLTTTDICPLRASGLIPVIPLTVISKDTQLPKCIKGQAINY